MRRKCCVPTCNSTDKCNVCQVGISYFKTPRERSTIKKWELALGLKDQSLLPQDRVCSLHFRKCDIVTKRYISMKRPSTNGKMILEISKLERDTVPTVFRHEIKQCSHGQNKKTMFRSRSEGSSGTQSDETESSENEFERLEKQKLRPSRRDYRLVTESVEHRSKRRQIRALSALRIKWLDKIKVLKKQTRFLENHIRDLEIGRCDSSVSE